MRRLLFAILSVAGLGLSLGCHQVDGFNDCDCEMRGCHCHCNGDMGWHHNVERRVIIQREMVPPPKGKGSGSGSGSSSQLP